ncbi:argininosuccinate lyase [Vallitalea guaymasensis]|uniref:Argininosuccinate lyase n=2 Tax=Vallitalea guaymasensis TaxID=1185412 RepID=A0A8J8MDS5_9FIRM|nr:argininosuccinate lyase [Vallitalea guaymasensis]QUH30973.1 argininosuccinate lyase [Vallitalea guaymasensis]
MKLWGGRFEKATNVMVDDFNSSIRFDKRLYKQDINGSIAHVTMLGKQDIIPQEDADVIKKGLQELLLDIENNKVAFDIEAEDIHMNIEKLLIEKIGIVGKKLHTGRSRNDQVTLDMRMYLKEEIIDIKKLVINLLQVLLDIAKNNTETIMPGYTHLQKAQPITFAHHVMAYFEMLKRDIGRLDDTYKRTNSLPLGAGALATTTYPLDREYVAELLDFDNVCLNSIDAVSDRDYCIELINSLSMLMMHLSRFSEEIILWCSNEFQFIELDDAYSTGSSIMPQKKNPDIAELVRGKTGRVYGSLIGLLTTIKSLPLAYNKDMQEDKEATFDAIDTVKMCLPIFTDMLKTMKINKEKMYDGAGGGFTNATDAADYLVKKNLPFRDAHAVIGKLVLYCVNNNKNLEDMTLDEYKSVSPIFEDDIYEAISLETCVNKRNVIGGPSKEMMCKVINMNQEYLAAVLETID